MPSRREEEGNHTLVSAIVRTILPVEPILCLFLLGSPSIFTQACENLIVFFCGIPLILANRPKSHEKETTDRLKCQLIKSRTHQI